MPETIAEHWKRDSETLRQKSFSQILAFVGDGKLRDNSATSHEIREFFDILPTEQLEIYTNECLTNNFDQSGYALQDLVNELGKRLGFRVEPGLYRGRVNAIGHDGLWLSENHDIVIEIKSSNTYSFDINKIANYRRRLIGEGRIEPDTSSILIVVGRDDTESLESQVRGSKHAWDIRLISVESLLKLVYLKQEMLDDEATFNHICKILKPMEFTRLDYVIDAIFFTGRDIRAIEEAFDDQVIEEEVDQITVPKGNLRTCQIVEYTVIQEAMQTSVRQKPVAFHEDCIPRIEKWLNIALKKKMRTIYENTERNVGLSCAVSKDYNPGHHANSWWFAFHSSQMQSLRKYDEAYVCFGCGSAQKIFAFDFLEFVNYLDKMSKTERSDRKYWHVRINQIEDRYILTRADQDHVDITDRFL